MEEFRGVIGRYFNDSRPWWPPPNRPRPGTPNVVFVVLDDVGFAQLGCFGSIIETPVFDALAARGLRYRNFHTTSLCSPTRSCLLTGRNHHTNGMGRVIELATGFPGYNATMPRENGMLPEMLVPLGFAAYAVGKWHLAPDSECHQAARRDRWPLGRGFERFYGFLGGETHQYAPALVQDNQFVDPPIRDDYHLTADIVDKAVEYVADLRAVDPEKPFFLYVATGACHSPHQAPREWIDKYRGAFDHGWDVERERILTRQIEMGLLPPNTELSPRHEWVPAWDSLSSDEHRLYARFMEAFAGFLSHTDHHIGRVVEFLAETGDLDNTLLFVLSDNGASSEGGPAGSVNDVRLWNVAPRPLEEALARIDEIGGPRMHNNYPWGWTLAGNTPFKRWKREVHEGGVCDPLIVHWPNGISDGGAVRSQYVHAIDLLPTVLDVLDVEAPDVIGGVEQRPIEGVSFVHTVRDAASPSRHDTQYYEMFGSRALYHRGWKAVTYHLIQAPEPGFDEDVWELYHVDEDASECHDLAADHPDKLKELIDLWWREAERYQVLPLDNRPFSEFVFERPDGLPKRHRYVFFTSARPGMVPEDAAPNLRNRSHRVTADIEIYDDEPAHGVLVSQGNVLGGWSLFVKDGLLTYVHNYVGLEQHRISTPVQLPVGRHRIEFVFTRTEDHAGVGSLHVNGKPLAERPIKPFTPMRFSLTGAGLRFGVSDAAPVCADYEPPFAFSGSLRLVTIDVDGEIHVDPDGEAAVAIATQ